MRRYLVFAVASIALLLSSIDATAVAVAFPVITSSFDVSIILAGWIMTAYQLVVTAAIPLSGKISDALGRKTTFIAFLALFTVGSFLCSIAPNVPSLIAFRVIQGLGGSGFLPSASGIVSDQFPQSRQRALGLFTSIFPIGQILGPNVGGWLTSALGWRSIFWINIPLGIVALIAAPLLLPRGKREGGHIDFIGSLLLALSLAALMGGISVMGSSDGSPPWALVVFLLSCGLVGLLLFWRRESRVDSPVIEPEVFREKPFLAANAYNVMYGCAIGAVSLVPLYSVSIYGMSTLESGLVLTPRSVGMMVMSTVSSFLLLRWGYRLPMAIGIAAVIPAFILLGLEPTNISVFGMPVTSTMFIVTVMALVGLGVGTAAPAANNACIELMPDRVGTIVGVRSMFRQAGSILSITVGSLLLHNAGLERGFQFIYIGLGVLMLVVMAPAIIAMTSPKCTPKIQG